MGALVDLLLPPRCLACGGLTREAREPVDATRSAPTRRTPPALCIDCHDLLEPDGEAHLLAPGVVALSPYAYADPLATAIKRVKTDALRDGARSLARLLDPVIPTSAVRTWVPAPRGRRRQRGLDLPELLAGPGGRRLLQATRSRVDQTDLDAVGRRAAVSGAYRARGPVPRAVVLVDDVRATGATLRAAATALQEGGAVRVLAVSLAASAGTPSAASDLS